LIGSAKQLLSFILKEIMSHVRLIAHLILAVSFATAVGSCKKEEPLTPKQETVAQLRKHRWRISSYYDYYAPRFTTPRNTDVYAAMPTCRRDDFLEFNPGNNIVSNEEGDSRCATTDPQSRLTTWEVSDDGQQVSFGDLQALGFSFLPYNNKLGTFKDGKLTITASDYYIGSQTVGYSPF
jgi:hypothetical protein